MSVPFNAKQRHIKKLKEPVTEIPLPRGDSITVTQRHIQDGDSARPFLVIENCSSGTMTPYYKRVAAELNRVGNDAADFRIKQLEHLIGNAHGLTFTVTVPYLVEHFEDEVGKISVLINPGSHFYKLYFHPYRLCSKHVNTHGTEVGVINGHKKPSRLYHWGNC